MARDLETGESRLSSALLVTLSGRWWVESLRGLWWVVVAEWVESGDSNTLHMDSGSASILRRTISRFGEENFFLNSFF